MVGCPVPLIRIHPVAICPVPVIRIHSPSGQMSRPHFMRIHPVVREAPSPSSGFTQWSEIPISVIRIHHGVVRGPVPVIRIHPVVRGSFPLIRIHLMIKAPHQDFFGGQPQ